MISTDAECCFYSSSVSSRATNLSTAVANFKVVDANFMRPSEPSKNYDVP